MKLEGTDMKHVEKEMERKYMEQAAQEELHHHQDIAQNPDENPWYPPSKISRMTPPLVERGNASVEKVVLYARQATTLSALFLNRDK